MLKLKEIKPRMKNYLFEQHTVTCAAHCRGGQWALGRFKKNINSFNGIFADLQASKNSSSLFHAVEHQAALNLI